MKLNSCQNCWFNGLQYGALGLAVGYCARHKKILNASDVTTCGFHLRKDLTVNRAKEVSEIHKKYYKSECVTRIVDAGCYETDVSDSDKDKNHLRGCLKTNLLNFNGLSAKIEGKNGPEIKNHFKHNNSIRGDQCLGRKKFLLKGILAISLMKNGASWNLFLQK